MLQMMLHFFNCIYLAVSRIHSEETKTEAQINRNKGTGAHIVIMGYQKNDWANSWEEK